MRVLISFHDMLLDHNCPTIGWFYLGKFSDQRLALKIFCLFVLTKKEGLSSKYLPRTLYKSILDYAINFIQKNTCISIYTPLKTTYIPYPITNGFM